MILLRTQKQNVLLRTTTRQSSVFGCCRLLVCIGVVCTIFIQFRQIFVVYKRTTTTTFVADYAISPLLLDTISPVTTPPVRIDYPTNQPELEVGGAELTLPIKPLESNQPNQEEKEHPQQ